MQCDFYWTFLGEPVPAFFKLAKYRQKEKLKKINK
jgi:hypothetical protein